MSLDHLLATETIVAVFSGTVREIETVPAGQVVTFTVDRVWKGEVGELRVVYYRREPGFIEEQITFRPKTPYFVAAYRPLALERALFALPPEAGDFLATNYCVAHEFKDPGGPWAQQVLRGAPGHPPR